jgi:hypothetical protein
MSSVCFGAHRYRIGPIGSRLTPDSVRWTHAGGTLDASLGQRRKRCSADRQACHAVCHESIAYA